MVELNILVVVGKIRTLVVFAARPWITLYVSRCQCTLTKILTNYWPTGWWVLEAPKSQLDTYPPTLPTLPPTTQLC